MIDLGMGRDLLYAARRILVHRPEGKRGWASGFMLRDAAGVVYLVTNRHAVDTSYMSQRASAHVLAIHIHGHETCDDYGEHATTFVIANPRIYYATMNDDVAVVPLDKGVIIGHDHNCPILRLYHIDTAAKEDEFITHDRSESVEPGDVVAVCGYPEIGGQQTERPIALFGFLSSDPAHPVDPPLRIGSEQMAGNRVVLFQGFSRSGASGSPVVAVQRGLTFGGGLQGPPHRPMRLIGINAGRLSGTQHNPVRSHTSYDPTPC